MILKTFFMLFLKFEIYLCARIKKLWYLLNVGVVKYFPSYAVSNLISKKEK